MLFLKTLFIATILFFGTSQCLSNPNNKPDKLAYIGQLIEDFFSPPPSPPKEPTAYELLTDVVKNRASHGLKDYKNSVRGLDMPEMKQVLKDAGEYVVIKLDTLVNDVHSILKDLEGTEVTLLGYRVGSPSEYYIVNAARLFLITTTTGFVLYLIEFFLSLFKSSYSRLFY